MTTNENNHHHLPRAIGHVLSVLIPLAFSFPSQLFLLDAIITTYSPFKLLLVANSMVVFINFSVSKYPSRNIAIQFLQAVTSSIGHYPASYQAVSTTKNNMGISALFHK
jgi:hypothetical protein